MLKFTEKAFTKLKTLKLHIVSDESDEIVCTEEEYKSQKPESFDPSRGGRYSDKRDSGVGIDLSKGGRFPDKRDSGKGFDSRKAGRFSGSTLKAPHDLDDLKKLFQKAK